MAARDDVTGRATADGNDVSVAPQSWQVILVRHAHADWPGYDGRDFDRPLTPRGEQEALATGRSIGAAGHRPALVVASPARRTRQTAEIICEELELPAGALRLVDTLYNAAGPALAAELRRHATHAGGMLMLVAHNPGISDVARRLAGDAQADGFAPADWRVLALR
jgi:phosphohistidine phosphatase